MISLGTESLILHNKVPKIIANEMAVPYMEGSFSLPIKYGYAVSGVLDNGEKVHLMHPHQNQCLVAQSSLFKSCQDLPLKRIPLISNMETIINGIWDSQFEKNDSIVIIGFGNIGSLLATTLKYHYNLDARIVETDQWRLNKAKTLGFDSYCDNQGFDIAFNTASNEKALQFAIDQANEEGKIIDLSWYGNTSLNLDLGGKFHINRLRIIASQVSNIPKSKRGEFDYHKRKQLAVEILKHPKFDDLITSIIPFEEAPKFYDSIRINKVPKGLIYLIKY